MSKNELTASIRFKALELGHDLCGIIPAETFGEFTRGLEKRMEDFPESKGEYEGLRRLAAMPENAKSVIVCAHKYTQYKIPACFDGLIGKCYLFDGRLGFTQEFEACKGLGEFLTSLGIAYKQNSVSARWAAQKAGLGFFGRNNFLYTKFGSYAWINTWEVDAELDYTQNAPDPGIQCLCNDHCRKCVEACPTKALSGDFAMDKRKCVAQISFGGPGAGDTALHDPMGTWIYGCDACQDACPMNKGKFNETTNFPRMDETERGITLEKILLMDDEYFEKILHPRFWYLPKERMWVWKCNALRAMANSGDAKYRALIRNALAHDDEQVRKTAQWACEKLGI